MAIESYEQVGEFVEMLVKQLVDNPDDVQVSTHEERSGEAYVEVAVDSGDVGKVIGRQGRTIKAIRTLARAAASDAGYRVEVELASEGA